MEENKTNSGLIQFENTRSKALVYLFKELEKIIPNKEVEQNERHRGKTIQLKLADEKLR